MKEIVNRLHENRQIELARSILESNGYKVVDKKMMESSDDSDEYDFFRGNKFIVSGSESVGREDMGAYDTIYTNDPAEAIEAWFRIGEKIRTETDISAKTKSDAQELIDWAYDHQDRIKSLYQKYHCPYKLDWMLNSINRTHEQGIRGFYENEFGDEISPFSRG